MSRQKISRPELLEAMAGYVLDHGLNTASLRPLAQAAGTSDRMLIYHFGSKEALIAELLAFLADRYAQLLDQALPEMPMASRQDCLMAIMKLIRADAFRPFLRVWLDIVSSAAQGNKDHMQAGGVIIDRFLEWIERRLPVDDPNPKDAAKLIQTLIEGVFVMDAVGRASVSDAALETVFEKPRQL